MGQEFANLIKGCRAAGFCVPDALVNSSERRLVFVIRDTGLLLEFKFLSLGHRLMLAPIPAPCKRTRGGWVRSSSRHVHLPRTLRVISICEWAKIPSFG